MTQIDILSGAISAYSEEAIGSTERLIREHHDAMACADVEEGITLLLFTFHGLARFAYRISNEERVAGYPPDWKKVFEFCFLLQERMAQQIDLLPDCEELGRPMERAEESKWAFTRLSGLCGRLKECYEVDSEIEQSFEDFSDLVESDKVRMNPATEYIPWKVA